MKWHVTQGAAAFLAAGCANMSLEPSGFLEQFEQLQPAPELQVAFIPDEVRWWEQSGLDWSLYSRVAVTPVEWRPVSKRARRVSAKTAERLCEDFHEKLSERLVKPTASEGRSVTVRAAITDVAASSVLLNIVTLIVLFPIDMGGIRGEIEVRDTTTGELLAAMSAYREGTPFLLLECFSRYGHARHGMKKWTGVLERSMSAIEPNHD